jgi:hypothetical protein
MGHEDDLARDHRTRRPPGNVPGDLLDGLRQDDHRDVFPDDILQNLQTALERAGHKSLGAGIEDHFGVISGLVFRIEDLVGDGALAEGPVSVPIVEDHGQAGGPAEVPFQPFFKGDRLDQMAPLGRRFLILGNWRGKKNGRSKRQDREERHYPSGPPRP